MFHTEPNITADWSHSQSTPLADFEAMQKRVDEGGIVVRPILDLDEGQINVLRAMKWAEEHGWPENPEE